MPASAANAVIPLGQWQIAAGCPSANAIATGAIDANSAASQGNASAKDPLSRAVISRARVSCGRPSGSR
jgi:hypothetical protein